MQTFKARGEQLRHFHRLGDLQTDYFNMLAAQCGARQMPKWFTDTWRDAQQSREADPVNFRDMPLPVRGPTVVNV
jgi:hypothetical protein